MRLIDLFERRNRHLSPKKSALEELEKYRGRDDVFVSFTDDVGIQSADWAAGRPYDPKVAGIKAKGKYHNIRGSKLGINPKSSYQTPLGIYAYPIDYVIEKESRGRGVEFGSDRPYLKIFRSVGNILNLDTYSDEDLTKDIEKIKEVIAGMYPNIKQEALEHIIDEATTHARRDVPGSKLWNITRMATMRASRMAAEYKSAGFDVIAQAAIKDTSNSVQWSKLFRLLGYGGAIDPSGLGIIHPSEPTQGVFFSIRSIVPLETIHNISPQKEKSWEDILSSNLDLFAKELYKNKVPLELAKEIFSGLTGSVGPASSMILDWNKLPEDFKAWLNEHKVDFVLRNWITLLRWIPFDSKSLIHILELDPNMAEYFKPEHFTKEVLNFIFNPSNGTDRFQWTINSILKNKLGSNGAITLYELNPVWFDRVFKTDYFTYYDYDTKPIMNYLLKHDIPRFLQHVDIMKYSENMSKEDARKFYRLIPRGRRQVAFLYNLSRTNGPAFEYIFKGIPKEQAIAFIKYLISANVNLGDDVQHPMGKFFRMKLAREIVSTIRPDITDEVSDFLTAEQKRHSQLNHPGWG